MAQLSRRIGRGGRITWRARIRLKNGSEQSASFDRKTDAAQWAQRIESDIRSGRHFPDRETKRRTVADLLARYRAEVLPNYSRREQAQRTGKLAWWEQQIGSLSLFELTSAEINECRMRLVRGEGLSGRPASPATQVRYLAVIKHVLSFGRREWKWIQENPAELVRSPREPRGRVRYLSEEERDRLLAACKASSEPRLYPLVIVALGTGARQSELLRLRWRDIDLQRRTAVLHETKNKERRALVLAGPVLQVLREMSAVRRIGTDDVFVGRRQPVAAFPRQAWEEALRAAEISDFRFHDIRHTFASYLAMSGATLAELADALGHKTLAMVKRYAHLSEQHTSRVVSRMVESWLG